MPKLVSLTHPNLQILGKTQTGVLPDSKTSDDIHMKLGPVTKLNKINKTPLKKIDDDVIP